MAAAAYNVSLFNEVKGDEGRKEFIESILHQMKWSPHESVLDIGCGPGDVTRNTLWPLLQPYDIQGLTGIDCDDGMVCESSEKHSVEGKVHFAKADIGNRQSFPADWQEKFHKCFSFYALQDIPRMRSAVMNLNWLLKKGGECGLVICTYSPAAAAEREILNQPKWANFSEDLKLPGANEIFCSPDVPAAFKTLFEQCGFDVKLHWESQRTREFETSEEYMDHMIGLDSNVNRIPENLQKDYREEKYTALMKIPIVGLKSEVRPAIDENGVHLKLEKILHIHAVKIRHALI